MLAANRKNLTFCEKEGQSSGPKSSELSSVASAQRGMAIKKCKQPCKSSEENQHQAYSIAPFQFVEMNSLKSSLTAVCSQHAPLSPY